MKFYTIPPPPNLAAYVRCFWVFESDVLTPTPYVYRSMADGCAELIFHYQGTFTEVMARDGTGEQGVALIHAPSQHFRRFVTNERFGIFGVYMYPFAIPRLFALPSTDLRNQMPTLETLLGVVGKELAEQMMLAKDNGVRVQVMARFLEKQLDRKEEKKSAIEASIAYVIRSGGTTDVRKLADTFNLSPRQLERKFKEVSGFSPKLFSRIIRFQSALKQYENKGKSLTSIAYECGYYDQSHFINDFKEFSGYHPGHYFAGKAEGIEYRDA